MEYTRGGLILHRAENNARVSNRAEVKCLKELKSKGGTVHRKGWPDFLVETKEGKIVAIEVKRSGRHIIKASQMDMMRLLSQSGIECYRWSPDTGLKQLFKKPDQPRMSESLTNNHKPLLE